MGLESSVSDERGFAARGTSVGQPALHKVPGFYFRCRFSLR